MMLLNQARVRWAWRSILVLIVSGAAAIEWLSGRPPICTCGSIKLWTGVVNGPENSQMVADWYSLSHIVHGLLLYGFLWIVARRWSLSSRLIVATLFEAAWELIENSPAVIQRYRVATIALGYSGDSIVNSMSDIAFMTLGFVLASSLPPRMTVALGLALELVSLVAIHDNLVLNVLMLVHPVDAIRRWQAGLSITHGFEPLGRVIGFLTTTRQARRRAE